MKLRLPVGCSLALVVLAGSFGCGSADNGAKSAGAAGLSGANVSGASNLGGAGVSGGASNETNGGAANGGAANGGAAAGGTSSACTEQPAAQRTQGTVLSLPLALVLSDKPFVFGQPNALDDGGSLVPLNLRFYISELELLQAGGDPIAVDAVTAEGASEPYGVHLFNAEDADSATLRVLAPPGAYTGLRFSLGLKLACNQQAPATLSDPLTDASQMTWPHAGGFLFLRYEGRYAGADSSASAPPNLPPAVHMGGDIKTERVPRVTVTGAFTVPASGTLEKGLTVAMDEIFKGATADIDVSDIAVGLLSTPEAIAGERLRRELPELHAFAFQP